MKKLRQFVTRYQSRKIPNRKGSNNPNWRGGERKLGRYFYVYKPGHPKAVRYGQTPYVLRATVNLEKKLGRRLKKHELPHHKNLNKLDDRLSNLKRMTVLGHNRLHHAGRSNKERVKIRRLNERMLQSYRTK